MNYYYYPLCSKDFTFENIFSSESVSPAKVYELRGFGADFFYTIKSFHHSEMIVLYNKPPKFSISDTKNESIKFILRIKEDSLDLKRLIFITEGIIGYPGTIYLTPDNFQLLFFSEKEITIACLRSEASLITKSYKKYTNNFHIINESECVEFDTSFIEKTNADISELEQTVSYDRKFNFFKGFCFGLASGLIRSGSNKESDVKRALQEVTNHFAEFKNKFDHESKGNYSRIRPKSADLKSNSESEVKVFNAIEKAEGLFKEIFPGKEYSESKLDEYVHEELMKHQFPLVEIDLFLKFKRMEDILLGTANLMKIKSSYLRNNRDNPILSFETLRECLRNYIASPNANSDWAKTTKERLNDSFKRAIFDLLKVIESQISKSDPNFELDFSAVKYNSKVNEVYIDQPFQNMDPATHNEYLISLNTILQCSRKNKGEAKKEDILNIVESVASKLSKGNVGKSSNLYQYLNGEINEYDANRLQSTVMKNFVAFVFNPDSLEKLENYLNAKGIETKWMAFTFWCSYNGFTNISRSFVMPFFNENRSKVSIYLDSYIEKCFRDGVSNLRPSIIALDVPTETLPKGELSASNDDRISIFFKTFVDGKYKLSIDQFQSIANLNDREKMISELRKRYRIPQKDSNKLIDQFQDILRAPSLF